MGNKSLSTSKKDLFSKPEIHKRLLLMGSVNSGKSTIFHQIQNIYNHQTFLKCSKENSCLLVSESLTLLIKNFINYFRNNDLYFDSSQLNVKKIFLTKFRKSPKKHFITFFRKRGVLIELKYRN
jgi:deoxyadenosine/deoxycytidine kinase